MKRILVVDDEPEVVRALERVRPALPAAWYLAFAKSHDALADMERERCGILVSTADARDRVGGDLLAEVRRRHPETMRFVLREDSPLGKVVRADAHRELARRGSTTAMVDGLVRGCLLHDAIHAPGVARVVGNLTALPSLPALYHEFVAATRNPSCTVESLGAIIAKDIALTAKVLQMVNSAMFGVSEKIVNPGAAAVFLGLDTLRSLVLSVQAFDQFDDAKLKHFTVESVWKHSMRVASFTRAILLAERCEKNLVEEGFLAGMMHDCGKLVLATVRADRFQAACTFAERDNVDRAEIERRIFGATHAAVGGHVLARWGLPSSVVEAVAFHCAPSNFADHDFSTLHAVHVANQLSRIDLAKATPENMHDLDRVSLQRVGRESRLPRWIEACREAAAQAKPL